MMIFLRCILLLACANLAPPAIAAETVAPYPVAGLTPHERPQGAPSLRDDGHAKPVARPHWIPSPPPPGLGFIEKPGAWYSPFFHPGVPAPYDVHGSHRQLTRKEAK